QHHSKTVIPSPLRGEGRERGHTPRGSSTKLPTPPKAPQLPRKHRPLSSVLSPRGRGSRAFPSLPASTAPLLSPLPQGERRQKRHPSVTRSRCTRPSSTSATASPASSVWPSISIASTPRQTRCGFSTLT